MKYNKLNSSVILFVLMLLMSLRAAAQVEEFEKYADEKGVSYVYISKTMLSMASKFGQAHVGNVKLGTIINKLNSVQVISPENQTTSKRLYEETKGIVKNGKYELMLQTGDDREKVFIYNKEAKSKKYTSVVIILTHNEKDTNVVVLTGTFTQKDLQTLGGL